MERGNIDNFGQSVCASPRSEPHGSRDLQPNSRYVLRATNPLVADLHLVVYRQVPPLRHAALEIDRSDDDQRADDPALVANAIDRDLRNQLDRDFLPALEPPCLRNVVNLGTCVLG